MISTTLGQRTTTMAVAFATIVCLVAAPWAPPAPAAAAVPTVHYTGRPQSVEVSSWAQTETIVRDDYTVTAPPPPPPVVKKVSRAPALAPAPAPAPAPARRAATPRKTAPWAPVPSPGSAKATARSMLAARGWGDDQFGCLSSLWDRESGWNATAQNGSSGAYGIPQALPGSKMASAGADWATNPATQISWGLGYISGRYGTPCGAWSHSEAHGWY